MKSLVLADVSAHSQLTKMAKAASAAMGLLIGLGQSLEGAIEDQNESIQNYISEVATLYTSS